MEVKKETLEVIPRDLAEPVHGARPEPEEMPARRVLQVDSEATLGGLGSTNVVGQFNTKIVYEEDTLTMAQLGGKQCRGCLHWSNETWRKLYAKNLNDPMTRRFLNNLRKRMPDGEEEEQIRAMGLCAAFSEINQNTVITHPLACCPTTDDKGSPVPLLFTPRDAASKNLAAAIYDKTLRMASRKIR